MYKICKTDSSAKRQREIENCLLELMSLKPYEDISVTELSDRINIPRKAFYRYFDSKDDALNALIDHTMADYFSFSDNNISNRQRSLRRELGEYFSFWYSKKHLLSALDRSGLFGVLIDRSVGFPIRDKIALEKFMNEKDKNTLTEIFRFAFSGLVYTMIGWYKDGFKTSISDMSALACRLLSEPLFPRLRDFGIGE